MLNIGDVDMTTLIAVGSVLIVFASQLLLCFKVKALYFKLLPPLILTVLTALFFIMTKNTTSFDALGYALLAIFSGLLLASSLLAFLIFGFVKLIKRKKHCILN